MRHKAPFRHTQRERISFADELALAEFIPYTRGEHAGMTLDEIARSSRGLALLRHVSRGTFSDPTLDAIRNYLRTINTWTPTSDEFARPTNP